MSCSARTWIRFRRFFPADEDSEHIYGRGSCDAKGILAAQVAAAERLKAEGVKDLGLLYFW